MEHAGPPSVPLSAVDELLSLVAGHLHDQPVQSLVAAKLMVESATPADDAAAALRDRGVQALGRAAQQSRDVMWVLERRVEVPDDAEEWAEVLAEHLRRAGGEVPVDVSVTLSGDGAAGGGGGSRGGSDGGGGGLAGREDLVRLQGAVLDVAAAALVAGATVRRVVIEVGTGSTGSAAAGSAAAGSAATVVGAGELAGRLPQALVALATARCDELAAGPVEGDAQDDGFTLTFAVT